MAAVVLVLLSGRMLLLRLLINILITTHLRIRWHGNIRISKVLLNWVLVIPLWHITTDLLLLIVVRLLRIVILLHLIPILSVLLLIHLLHVNLLPVRIIETRLTDLRFNLLLLLIFWRSKLLSVCTCPNRSNFG